MNAEDEYLHDELLDFTIIGAAHMAYGLTQFPAWSKAMLTVEGTESLHPFLRVIFCNSKIMLERTRRIFEGHDRQICDRQLVSHGSVH